MAKVYDLELIAIGDALVASALGKDANVLNRLTDDGIEDVMGDKETTLISLRVPTTLLERFDAMVRERAYREGQRITRNGSLVELMELAVADQERQPPRPLIDHPPEYEKERNA
jgi:hypothetical protein